MKCKFCGKRKRNFVCGKTRKGGKIMKTKLIACGLTLGLLLGGCGTAAPQTEEKTTEEQTTEVVTTEGTTEGTTKVEEPTTEETENNQETTGEAEQ